MLRTQLLIADCSRETGSLLTEYMEERGVIITSQTTNVISYGVHKRGALNGVCGRGKIFNMKRMEERGVRTVPWFEGDNIPRNFSFPLLARKTHGYGGKDLIPVFQPEEITWRIASGWDWFSQYIPIQQEYRCWIFRDHCLDVYKKVMNRPNEYKYIGRNFRNGFDFQLVNGEEDVVNEAIKAVSALDLDFAAIDLLRGKDGLVYVLETNTAPGAIKSGAQKTLGKLADCMVEWLENQR